MFFQTTGTHFHHAVELLLKSEFADAYSDEQLKKEFGHNLGHLWSKFKEVHSSADLSRFDSLIEKLNKWEGVRYPSEKAHTKGFSLRKGERAKLLVWEGPRPDEFELNLEEVDELVKTLLAVMKVNLNFFGLFQRDEVKEILRRENQHLREFG